MPAPAIAAAAIRGMQAARTAMGALNEERTLARRSKALAQANKAKTSLKSKTESVERLAKKLKQLKRIGWLIKGVTLGTTSIGDVFISLWVLAGYAAVETFLFPLLFRWWKQEWWEKILNYSIILGAFIILLAGVSILLLILGFVGGGNLLPTMSTTSPPFGVPANPI
ncbi:MAG: hypothetical protein Q8P77_00620 [Candidatus Veblenbacteria bacterium]|nr:hypothetical protein [Candidatus Veblenbacteria bacterium]